MQILDANDPAGFRNLGGELVEPIEPRARHFIMGACQLLLRFEPVFRSRPVGAEASRPRSLSEVFFLLRRGVQPDFVRFDHPGWLSLTLCGSCASHPASN